MHSELMRVSDFCKRYSVSRATVYRLVKRRELPICKIGSATRIKASDADAWFRALPESAAT